MPRFAHPILTLDEARELERKRFGEDEAAEWGAMQLAGRRVAHGLLLDFQEAGSFPDGARILVLVGKGHNGGDALIAAAELARLYPKSKYDVVLPYGQAGLRPLAGRAWREFHQAGRERVRLVASPSGTFDVSVDGLFGFQFRPPLDETSRALLRQANACSVRLRAAIDLPSGLGDADAYRADFTYATGSVKRPVVDDGALPHVGRLRYLDLGFFDHDTGGAEHSRVLTERVLDPLRALRPAQSDKRTYGHLAVVAGSRRFPGAALMAVRAALHAGVGLVTAFVPESLAGTYAAQVPEAMWVPWPETPAGALALEGMHLVREAGERATAWLMGPGLGREGETLAMVRDVARTLEKPVVFDADALQPEIVRAPKGPKVVTPHAGEWARISGGAAGPDFARNENAVLVLKGPLTQVITPKNRFFSPAGGPVLARGGSGDLLAGMIGGRVAQTRAHLEEATCEAVLWHGLAAEALARARGQVAVTTTELLEFLPHVLREPRGNIRIPH